MSNLTPVPITGAPGATGVPVTDPKQLRIIQRTASAEGRVTVQIASGNGESITIGVNAVEDKKATTIPAIIRASAIDGLKRALAVLEAEG